MKLGALYYNWSNLIIVRSGRKLEASECAFIVDQFERGISLETQILYTKWIFLRQDRFNDVQLGLHNCRVTWRFFKLLTSNAGFSDRVAYINTRCSPSARHWCPVWSRTCASSSQCFHPTSGSSRSWLKRQIRDPRLFLPTSIIMYFGQELKPVIRSQVHRDLRVIKAFFEIERALHPLECHIFYLRRVFKVINSSPILYWHYFLKFNKS